MVLSPQYLAGFYDGEGSVNIYESWSNGYQKTCLRVTIGNTHEGVIRAIADAYEGRVKQLKGWNRPVYMVKLVSSKAVRFLQDIQPYAVVRAQQLQLALDYWAFTHQPREQRFERVEATNSIGGARYRRRPEVVARELQFIESLKHMNHNHAALVG